MGSTLRDALAVGSREIVVFVGAGGKTTSMYRLARELHGQGAGVVITTTTRMFPPAASADLSTAVADDLDQLLRAAGAALAAGQIAVLARALTPQAKLDGVPAEWVAAIAELPGVTHVLVEGDGAAGKPFTAPRDYEPVIPAAATLVVPVVGADALGQPLAFEVAHRPERVSELAGLAPGDPIDARAIAIVMLHPQGNTKGRPAGARVVPLINKADVPERLVAARQIAAELCSRSAGRVVIAAVAGEPPVVEVVG